MLPIHANTAVVQRLSICYGGITVDYTLLPIHSPATRDVLEYVRTYVYYYTWVQEMEHQVHPDINIIPGKSSHH